MSAAAVPLCRWLVKPLAAERVIRWADRSSVKKRTFSAAAKQLAHHQLDDVPGTDGAAIPSEPRDFVRTLINESDRGAVLVAAAVISDTLGVLLQAQFLDQEGILKVAVKPLLRDGTGPLGTMWARARLAYALGLISPRTFTGIEAVRDLRNTFAHSSAQAVVTDEIVDDLLDLLDEHEQLIALSVAGVAGDLLSDVPENARPGGVRQPRNSVHLRHVVPSRGNRASCTDPAAAQLRVAPDAARSWPGACAPAVPQPELRRSWQPEPAARVNA
jgi:DNA-binding MltR family transcriptional regulator